MRPRLRQGRLQTAVRKIPHPQRTYCQKRYDKLPEAFAQIGHGEITVAGKLIGEIAADKEKYRHVYFSNKLEQHRTVDVAYAHRQHVPHHHQIYGDALQHIERSHPFFSCCHRFWFTRGKVTLKLPFFKETAVE